MDKKRFYGDYDKISVDEINKAVGTILKELNMNGGSVGGFDLYRLLQVYFREVDKRDQINKFLGISGVWKG
jgi:hypothetical protein